MRKVYTMNESQMEEWKEICNAYAKKINAKLLFVNETSFGIQLHNGELQHIYIDELVNILRSESKRGKNEEDI